MFASSNVVVLLFIATLTLSLGAENYLGFSFWLANGTSLSISLGLFASWRVAVNTLNKSGDADTVRARPRRASTLPLDEETATSSDIKAGIHTLGQNKGFTITSSSLRNKVVEQEKELERSKEHAVSLSSTISTLEGKLAEHQLKLREQGAQLEASKSELAEVKVALAAVVSHLGISVEVKQAERSLS